MTPRSGDAVETGDTTAYWDALLAEWGGVPGQRLWRRHSDAVNSDLLARWLPAPPLGRVLKTDLFDEAVGTGLVPVLLSSADAVTGVDISGAVVDAAQRRYPALLGHRADVRDLPFPEASFDVVVSNSTLDHFDSLADVPTALRELNRVLRPGGTLLLTLDNRANPAVALRNALPARVRSIGGLVPSAVGATCGPRRLSRLVRAAGFEVVARDTIVHCPRVLAVLGARLVERRGRIAAERRYLRLLLVFERLRRLPTRYVTGYFVAVRAIKR